ncbi:MAG TPA: lytic transglycosylase [Clostridiales bacterium]|nr:lytic transglycosylase [Clostridiales bacterium]
MSSKATRKKKIIIFVSVLMSGLIIYGLLIGIKEIRKSRYPIRYEEYVIKYSREYNVPQEVIYAVIYSESGFDENAKSSAGAIGLMQIIPDTYDWLSRLMDESYAEGDIYKPENNIKYGVFYLSHLYHDRFNNWDTALAAYNAGHGRVANWLNDTRYSDDGIALKEIPYEETRNYVAKVNKVAEIYIEIYFEDIDS